MDKEILGSVSGLSLEFSNNKQPHYHKGMEMRFSSKEELFSVDVIKNVIKESQHEEGASYLQFSLCQNLRIPLE